MKNYVLTSFIIIITIVLIISANFIITPVQALAQTQHQTQGPRLIFLVNQENFLPGDILVAYGKSFPNDTLVIRLFDPAGKAMRIESAKADPSGSFTAQIFTWPQPSKNFVFGRYTVEAASTVVPTYKENRTVSFSDIPSTGSLQSQSSVLSVKLDSPTQISVGKPFRIFVQVTFDGALVNVDDPNQLLSSSHIHSGNDTINLYGKFIKLHEGIYYADVKLDKEGTYIIHAIAFHRGFLSHDSKVVSSGSSIGEIQESVNSLKAELDKTSHELNATRSDITKAVDDARAAIKGDIETATGAVDQLKDASGQINSIILPILALISVIIALQISLFARIKASFK
jgi:outer membrane murein-binding lipoprotein Lpp